MSETREIEVPCARCNQWAEQRLVGWSYLRRWETYLCPTLDKPVCAACYHEENARLEEEAIA